MDRGTWQATVPWGHNESDTTEQLSLTLLTYFTHDVSEIHPCYYQ